MIGKILYFWVVIILLAFPSFTSATGFPERPIEILMPYGVNDRHATIQRVIAEVMSKHLRQQVIITPAIGAGGTVAGEKIAHRTKPDGYTLIQVNSGTNAVALFTKKDLNYKEDDFIYLGQTHASDLGLVVAPNAPFKTLEEFLVYARKNPNVIKHASTGIGTSGHLCYEYLKLKSGGLKIDLVPFRTAPEVTKAVVSGVTHSASIYGGGGGPNDELQKAREGGARVLAVTSSQRSKAWPEVPTFKEKGIDLVWSGWWGLGGPKGLPNDVLLVLKDVLDKTIQDPQVAKIVEFCGARVEFRRNEEFTAFIKEYNKIIEMLVREAKIPKN